MQSMLLRKTSSSSSSEGIVSIKYIPFGNTSKPNIISKTFTIKPILEAPTVPKITPVPTPIVPKPIAKIKKSKL